MGGGPAGLGPLLAASRDGTLDALLDDGLVIIERRRAIGAGRLGDYVIRSDSAAVSFLSCLDGVRHDQLASVRDMPAARAVAACGTGAVTLTAVAAVLNDVGPVLHGRRITRSRWRLALRARDGGCSTELYAGRLLLACGASQDGDRLAREAVFGVPLMPRFTDKIMQSDMLLRPEGIEAACSRLASSKAPRVVVIGGSTSAVGSARLLLRSLPDAGPASVTLLHRGRLRMFYHSPADARADGYDEFGPEDICPVSGFVHRLGGLRYDARDLLRNARGLERDVAPDARLAILDGDELPPADIEALLERADLVIPALGYRPRGLTLQGRDGLRIRLAGDEREPMVDDRCRVLDRRGEVLPGVFGIGLAAGFRTSGALGGEPSFRGQTNSLWLWQHEVGALVASGLLEPQSTPETAYWPRQQPIRSMRFVAEDLTCT